MTAVPASAGPEPSIEVVPPAPPTPSLAVVRVGEATPLVPPEVTAAEARWWHGMVVGIAIGIPLNALLWAGLTALAVGVLAEGSWPVWPSAAMGAVIGVFAGAFLGGWAGIAANAERLDEAELHAARRRRGSRR